MARSSQGELVLESWLLQSDILRHSRPIQLSGNLLTIPALIAVTKHNVSASLDGMPLDAIAKVDKSVQFLRKRLLEGESIYGVTTGFGGSADTNTPHTNTLQTALIQMQLSAVLPLISMSAGLPQAGSNFNVATMEILVMPETWVRGAILVRANSLLRGHSAVRLDVIKALLKLLEHNIIPLVPLRGSISASGDLCPLAYIAGALEGNPDVKVWTGSLGSRSIVSAMEALQCAKIGPVTFRSKEALGLLNGTAFSAAIASIGQHEADILAVFAQVLTAMGVEALMGTAESFHPFIGAVRPHRGQVEVAGNISAFLEGSLLARTGRNDEVSDGQLKQDRYPLRTSAQWIGPFLEDIGLAREQLEIELNSTTDNPLIDIEGQQNHHGGNFQATSVTSATEKVRCTLEKLGKMIFAQSTELLDVRLSHNLPPNLAVDEPSLSYTMKGVDINMASYMSELAFLANPVSNHVHSAEMGNQAINSLALISARYTQMAVDIVSLMFSAHLYTLCQALDLRAMDAHFMSLLRPAVERVTSHTFGDFLQQQQVSALHDITYSSITRSLCATTSKDSSDRFVIVAQGAQHHVLKAVQEAIPERRSDCLSLVTTWTQQVAATARSIFCTNREAYLADPDATKFLGMASKIMYTFVRKELHVPIHKGLVDYPTLGVNMTSAVLKKNTGTQISIIYEALRSGKLVAPIMECLSLAVEKNGSVIVPSKL